MFWWRRNQLGLKHEKLILVVKGRCTLQMNDDECDISRRPEGIVAGHLDV